MFKIKSFLNSKNSKFTHKFLKNNKTLIFSTIATTLGAGIYFFNKDNPGKYKKITNSETTDNMFNFFQTHSNDTKHTSLVFASKPKSNTFRGSVEKIIENKNNLKNITCIEFQGSEIETDIYDGSQYINIDKLSECMKIIADNNIKELNFDFGSKLSPVAGLVLAKALENNSSVEKIIVCANHLEHKGMLAILNSLTVNNSIQQLFIRSYNVHHHRYNWTTEEVQALVKVISTNKSLKSIKVPDNVIDSSDIHYLMKAYETNDFEHANISGFEVGLHRLPDFNHENVKNNEELKEWISIDDFKMR